MSSVKILTLNSCDTSNFRLGNVKKATKLLYDKESTFLKTPKLYLPFGAKINKFKTYSSFDEYYLDCSVSDEESEESVAFYKLISEIESTVVSLIEKDNGVLFKNFHGPVMLNSLFKKQDNYKPLIKLSLPRNTNGEFNCEFFDQEKNALVVSDSNVQELLSRGANFRAIIELDRVWFFNDKFGITLKLKQLKFSKEQVKQTETSTPKFTKLTQDALEQNYVMLEED